MEKKRKRSTHSGLSIQIFDDICTLQLGVFVSSPGSHPASFINCITISLMLKSINHHDLYHIISCYPFLTDGLILKNDPCFIQFTNPDPSCFSSFKSHPRRRSSSGFPPSSVRSPRLAWPPRSCRKG